MKTVFLDGPGLAGLRWQHGDLPVLALHGWLDNAHSFLPLAGLLDELDLVALDLPGHGQSRHRPPGCRYLFDDYVFDVVAAADALGWKRFHLLGHSLGGAVSSLVAAACPDRVISLALIEGLGPLTTPIDQTVSAWRKALQRSRPRPRRVHPDRRSAVLARSANGDLGEAEAALLAERGLIEADGGFSWSHDQRLTWPSPHRYTEPQVLELLAAIEAPVLNIYAEPASGILAGAAQQRRLAALRMQRRFAHAGGHHLHMQHPAALAPVIEEFFHEYNT